MRPIWLATLTLAIVCSAAGLGERSGYEAAATYSEGLGGRATLVMIDGKIVYERYAGGWTADQPHPLASGTKSVSGLLAAAAIEDGVIDGWDARISDAIEAWRADPIKREITVRHLLSLASGLDPNDPSLETRGAGPLGEAARLRQERIAKTGVASADDKYAAALAAKMTGQPGKQFEYGASHFYAFGAYLEARLAAVDAKQKTVESYFMQRIAEPIGMKVARWGRDKQGHVNLPGGMQLTAREWAKLGELVRLEGSVRRPDGEVRQVLRPALLAECLKPSATNSQYGLSWWLPSGDGDVDAADRGGINPNNPQKRVRQTEQMSAIVDANGKAVRVYVAAGLGKQRLLVLPDQRAVIVRFAEATRENQASFSDAKFVALAMGWEQAKSATRPAAAGAP